ncbi:hypothetical protein H2201_006294 [Coniosporium apollinis]|uniref:Uncharacterized protein n=1 Tax=Coniosporium apollinis TaxID=61459 RepID=A0ABQ9NU38_9PEZI|nr:hypothetical protein H2201_006294 [Coniosporium apollinis]
MSAEASVSNGRATLPPSRLSQFSPPANLPDLTPENKSLWSKTRISKWVNDEIAGRRPGQIPLKQFFNGTDTAYHIGQDGVKITWTGFPNKITKAFGHDDEKRWMAADMSRDIQDEYLEWSLIRDDAQNILRVTFTCEGPEYWEFLAERQIDTAIENIYKLNAPLLDEVPPSAFFSIDPRDTSNRAKWRYNPRNACNSTCTTGTITHLAHRANTLGDEINIAAQATVLRKERHSDKLITDGDKLIRWAKFGDPGRNSDPRIGYEINQLARQGISISVADPVGLYIHKFDTGNFRLDPTGDGDQGSLQRLPHGTFVFQRGDISKEQGLRLRIQIPDGVKNAEGRQLTVSDIYDTKTQRHIKYGAQFADYITMGVRAVAIPGGQPAPAEYCVGSEKTAVESFADMVPMLQRKIAMEVTPFARL